MPAPAPERLRVGVTGHRWNQLPEAARPALGAAVESALVAIGKEVASGGPEDDVYFVGMDLY